MDRGEHAIEPGVLPRQLRLAVIVVAYEAAAFIENLLNRVPVQIAGVAPAILLADDASTDDTAELARRWAAAHPEVDLEVLVRPRNLGYGGNQKAAFAWASRQGYDVVVLLHGDEQYPPERMEDLVVRLEREDLSAVYGSRMLERGAARRGGMPLVRRWGNATLTKVVNLLTGASLSEWFNGFRAYRVSALDEVGYKDLSDGFDFDTAITARLLRRGHRIEEVAMPTRYADEISRVPLLRTGVAAIRNGFVR